METEQTVALQPDKSAQTTIDYINTPKDEALATARNMAAQEEFTEVHRQQEITRIFAEASATAKERWEHFHNKYEDEIRKLEAAARLPIAPDPAEAATLAYVKQVVEARASGMQSTAEFLEFWKIAIETAKTDRRELPTLRVLADFHTRLNGRDENGRAVKLADTVHTAGLLAETVDLLMTPEQREARLKLAQTKVNQGAIRLAYGKALSALSPGWRIGKGGALVGVDSVRLTNAPQL